MKSYGEILIFALLLLTNLRVFVIKRTKVESLVILGPLSLVLSIFLILSWGFDIYTMAAFIMSFMVTLTNFHALIRFRTKVFIDHYSPLMKFWGVFTSIFSAAALIFTVLFMPVQLNEKKLEVTETKTEYQGSFKSGFEPAGNFSSRSAYVYEYTLFPDFKERRNVAVFVPDKRADTENYRPYLKLLAKESITVVSADFYSSDCRWFYNLTDSRLLRREHMLFQSLTDNQRFMSQREFYTYNISKELDALIPLLTERYGKDCNFYLVSDVMGNTAIQDYALKHPDKIAGTFFLDSIPEYKTPGYGCVAMTNPFLAMLLDVPKDKDTFDTRYLVLKTKEAILKGWLKQ